jgi:hypothetical protein
MLSGGDPNNYTVAVSNGRIGWETSHESVAEECLPTTAGDVYALGCIGFEVSREGIYNEKHFSTYIIV